jgi:hypothetical protein
MAGCYGNSQEDRAMEQELFRFLAEQDRGEDELEQKISDLFEFAATDEGAAKLEQDWELLINQLPAIVKMIAEAKQQASVFYPERKDRMAALGSDLVLMLGDELEKIAERML